MYRELRYRSLRNASPEEAERLLELAQDEVNRRWTTYEEMATRSAAQFSPGRPEEDMDLSTSYLGLPLRSPLVASASPVSASLDGIRACADHGVGAVVLYSLFEEQIRAQEVEDLLVTEAHEDAFGEALSYFPTAPTVALGGARTYLQAPGAGGGRASTFRSSPASTAAPPVAGPGSLTSMESAGASAIELNIYAVPGDVTVTGAAVEAQAPGHPRGGQGGGVGAGGSQAEPVLQRHRGDGPGPGRRRGGRAGALQPVPAARRRRRDADRAVRRHPLAPGGGPAADGPGSRSCTAGCGPRWRRPPGWRRARTWSRTCWRAPTW